MRETTYKMEICKGYINGWYNIVRKGPGRDLYCLIVPNLVQNGPCTIIKHHNIILDWNDIGSDDWKFYPRSYMSTASWVNLR